MKTIALLITFVFVATAKAQLHCNTVKNNGFITTTCYHENEAISTIEKWDSIHRSGNIKAYNNQGKELFNLSLRRFGGSASANVRYYPNGQVSRVDYSDSPDGGIQFYNSTTTFDENGKQTDFREQRYPYEYTTVPTPYKKPEVPKKQPSKTIKESAIYVTDFQLINTTKYTVVVELDANATFVKKSGKSLYVLQPKEQLTYDSTVDYKPFSQTGNHKTQPKIIVTKIKKHKKKLFLVSFSQNDEKQRKETVYWIVGEKK